MTKKDETECACVACVAGLMANRLEKVETAAARVAEAWEHYQWLGSVNLPTSLAKALDELGKVLGDPAKEHLSEMLGRSAAEMGAVLGGSTETTSLLVLEGGP